MTLFENPMQENFKSELCYLQSSFKLVCKFKAGNISMRLNREDSHTNIILASVLYKCLNQMSLLIFFPQI